VAPLFVERRERFRWADRTRKSTTQVLSSARTVLDHQLPRDGACRGAGEHYLDLTDEVPEPLRQGSTFAFITPPLEHVFEVRKAFGNLCALSRDAVIVVVPSPGAA